MNPLPVFPLNTVVFVNGTLQLQIFEQRYLSMVKNCLRDQHGFVTVLIRDGSEVDDTPEIFSVGTYAEIIDFNMLDNNLLGITIRGRQRAQINTTYIQHDNLISAEITFLDNLISAPNDNIDEDLLNLLQVLHKHPFVSAKYPEIDYTSAIEIAYKLSELLPASHHEKQQLLEADQTHSLFEQLKIIIARLESLNSGDGFL